MAIDDGQQQQEKQHLIVSMKDQQDDHSPPQPPTYNAIPPSTTTPSNNNGSSDDDDHELKTNIPLPIMAMCLCTGSFLAMLDLSICLTILPEIGTEFRQLSDIFGRKPVLVTITMLFLVGSAGCGFSKSLEQLIFFRALSGLGAGGLMLFTNLVTHDTVPANIRHRYQSYNGMVSSLGMAFGSPVGGFITDFFGWRYCFKINIIPFLLLLYVYMVHMKNYKIPSMNRIPNGTLMQRLKYIDFGGSILSCMGNTSLCAILILGGNTHDWSDPLVLSLMALAIMSYISLAVYECYVPRNPLVPPHLLGNRTVVLGCIGLWLLCSVVGGTSISMPQYYIGVLGFSTSKTGLCIMVFTFGSACGSYFAGRGFIQRYTKGEYHKIAVAFTSIVVIGVSIMYFWMLKQVPFMVGLALWALVGISQGFFFVNTNLTIPNSVAKSDLASTFSLIQISRQMGYMGGVAAASSVTQASLKILLHKRLKGPDAEEDSQSYRWWRFPA
ncbi:subfamily drug resistance transporter [Lichtheimia corymbifera JMRC:FSU:9682]|uniref:Subfamily drug resistance transporter n=1 Tax=Lichtheimia corymbifera JMRC:FSU:9682 TaxID=1263082 RepID=A0A068RLK6_9FUNG|nr:subfamily drug resistance transporter [Lichtheimia corymbifera JMRC:FSU:9682]